MIHCRRGPRPAGLRTAGAASRCAAINDAAAEPVRLDIHRGEEVRVCVCVVNVVGGCGVNVVGVVDVVVVGPGGGVVVVVVGVVVGVFCVGYACVECAGGCFVVLSL